MMLNHHSIIHLIISLTLTLFQCSFNTLLRVYIIHTLKCSFSTGDFAVYGKLFHALLFYFVLFLSRQ